MARFPLRAPGFVLLTVTILVASCQALFYGVGVGVAALPSGLPTGLEQTSMITSPTDPGHG